MRPSGLAVPGAALSRDRSWTARGSTVVGRVTHFLPTCVFMRDSGKTPASQVLASGGESAQQQVSRSLPWCPPVSHLYTWGTHGRHMADRSVCFLSCKGRAPLPFAWLGREVLFIPTDFCL